MQIKAPLLWSFVFAAGLAGAAQAGPIGSGLALTEATAQRALKARTVTVAHTNHACVANLPATLQQHPGVVEAKVSGDAVAVTFANRRQADEQAAAVRAAIAGACATRS